MFRKSICLLEVLLFLISFDCHNVLCYNKEVPVLKIGAIFDKSSKTQELALQKAIRDINSTYEDYIFQEVIEKIEYDNPFQAMQKTCLLLEQGVVGILGLLSEDSSNVVQSICDSKEIPHIDVRWDDYPLNGTLVNVHPFPDVLTRTYFDIIEAWGWEDFVILYENNESLQRVGELLKLFDPKKQRVNIRQLINPKNKETDAEDYRPVLKEMRGSGATHFVLDCSIDILQNVLHQAQQVGLMTYKHHFLITNPDLQTIDAPPFFHSETNITGMRFFDPDDDSINKVAHQIHTTEYKETSGWKLKLEEALIYDAIMIFAEAVKSARLLRAPTSINCYNNNDRFTLGTNIVNYMKNTEYRGLTGTVKFDNKGLRSSFMADIIEFMEGGVIKVGTWNSAAQFPLDNSRKPPKPLDQEVDISNRTFRISIALTEPYAMEKESLVTLKGNDRYEGFAIDLIHELSLMKGFNYTFEKREDNQNGDYNAELGRWTGMIGDVMSETVDLAIADLTITQKRANAVDFTDPFMTMGISILYQKASKAPPSFFSFADPFAAEVWKNLMVACAGVSLVLFIVGRISPTEWENPYPCIEEPEYLLNQLDLRNCCWFVTGSIMQQGSEIELKSVATRMVAGMWWFFTLLMVSSYTANLAAFLTIENPDTHFEDFEGLVKNTKGITYGAKRNGATENFFKEKAERDPSGLYAMAWNHMKTSKEMKGNKDGVLEAATGKYAFFMESSSIEYETQRKCNLEQVGNPLDEKGYGIAMKKNSNLRTVLSSAILTLQTSGKVQAIKKKWWEERRGGGQCNAQETKSEGTPLELRNVEGVFWVTIMGTLLAFFLAIIQSLMHTAKNSIRNKIPFREALKEEVRFYFRFSETEKTVTYNASEGSIGNKYPSEEKNLPYNLVDKQTSVETLQSNTNSTKSKNSKKSRKKYDKQASADTC